MAWLPFEPQDARLACSAQFIFLLEMARTIVPHVKYRGCSVVPILTVVHAAPYTMKGSGRTQGQAASPGRPERERDGAPRSQAFTWSCWPVCLMALSSVRSSLLLSLRIVGVIIAGLHGPSVELETMRNRNGNLIWFRLEFFFAFRWRVVLTSAGGGWEGG